MCEPVLVKVQVEAAVVVVESRDIVVSDSCKEAAV